MSTFFDRLEERRTNLHTTLCVGIDPRLERIPDEIRREAGDDVGSLLTRFGLELIDLVAELAACVKPQIAFFEAHGLPGMEAYARIVQYARERDMPVIGDVKRGDIGSTAAAYAAGHLAPGAPFEVDCVTLNPYLGADALEPFLEVAGSAGKGVYVLVRTSNPGAADLQELQTAPDDRRLFEHTAALVARLGDGRRSPLCGLSSVGAVVGATAPEALVRIRRELPDTPFLVPGYGAQGATAEDVAVGARSDGSGMVVNASRSIIHPSSVDEGVSWREAVVQAATRAREELDGAVRRA